MVQILSFLQQNGQWLFGTGGLAAAVILILRANRKTSQPAPSSISGMSGVTAGGNASVGGRHTSSVLDSHNTTSSNSTTNSHNVTTTNSNNTTSTKTGFGALEGALALAIIVAILGALLYVSQSFGGAGSTTTQLGNVGTLDAILVRDGEGSLEGDKTLTVGDVAGTATIDMRTNTAAGRPDP